MVFFLTLEIRPTYTLGFCLGGYHFRCGHSAVKVTDILAYTERPDFAGMVQRGSTEADEIRLQKLSFLQAKLLAHALSFPNLRSMVYSTCSTYKEENETVRCSRYKLAQVQGYKLPGLQTTIFQKTASM